MADGAWLDNGCTGVRLAEDIVVFAAHCGTHVSAAWFGDELDVMIDEDAGTARVAGTANSRELRTWGCAALSNFELGRPTDVGFCHLESSAGPSAQIIHPAQGCGAEAVMVGATVTLVGFGRDSALGPPGRKRTTRARVLSVWPDFEIGNSSQGTCMGDSGSPAFVRVGNDERAEWAIAGILSAGPQTQAKGVGYYAELSPVATTPIANKP